MKTANTWQDLLTDYDTYLAADSGSVEVIYNEIKAYAAANKLRFCDVLDSLHRAIFGPF